MLGAFATVATLAYLALQIRQNSRSVQGAGAASYREGLNSFGAILAQNGDLASLYYNWLEDPDSLSDADRLQAEQLLSMFVIYLQQAEELDIAGLLSSELAFTRDRQIEFLASQPGFHASYTKWGDFYPPRFRARVERAIFDTRRTAASGLGRAAAQHGAAADSA